MQYVYAVASFLGGLGAFPRRRKAVEREHGKACQQPPEKPVQQNLEKRFCRGVGIGLVSTMVVQSSSLTTVMVVGLVNAGIMSLYQATTIIMGANIGTTITAQIAALQTFDFISLAMALTSVGAFYRDVCQKRTAQRLPQISCAAWG